MSYNSIFIIQVQIDVKDINDNAPEFDTSNYIAVVLENVVPETSVLNVSAYDPDDGSAGLVHYKLIDEGHLQGIYFKTYTTKVHEFIFISLFIL